MEQQSTGTDLKPNTRGRQFLGSAALLLAALIWGCAFVAQSVGMEHVGPFTFNGIRLLIGGIVLCPVILLTDAWKKKHGTYRKPSPEERWNLLVGGFLAGVVLAVATNLQQIGLVETTAGKAGFLTAIYMVEVPFIGLFRKKRVRKIMWFCVALAVTGMYFLCIGEAVTLTGGDLLVFLCSFGFAAHITVIDIYAPRTDSVKLSCIQFWVAGILSLIMMAFTETPDFPSIRAVWFPLLYAGAMSCGVAYTFQILGQKRVPPTLASILMSLESVFALLGGMVIQSEVPTIREVFGCLLMFAAILLSQLPEGKRAKRQSEAHFFRSSS